MSLFGQQASPSEVLSSVSGEDLAQVFRDEGYFAELDRDSRGDPMVRFKVEGMKCQVYFYGVQDGRATSIQFHAGFRDRCPIEKVNEWNGKKRYLKVYLDEDREIVMDMDVDLEGGVTREYLRERLKMWRGVFLACVRFLAD